MKLLVCGSGQTVVDRPADKVAAEAPGLQVVGVIREEKSMLLRQLLNNPLLARLIARDVRRAHRKATRPMPGGTGSSFKQNRRRALQATARHKQRHLHAGAKRRKRTC